MNMSYLPRISSMFFLAIFLATIDLSLQQLQNLKDPESVPLGGTVTISCRFSTGTIADGNHPWWAQQHPDKPPRLLFYNTNIKMSDVPARFSASKAGNVMSLTITGALAEDEALYYCCLNPGSSWVFGGGTQLTVTGQDPVSPSVQVFAPSEQEIKTQKKATLVCLLSGFHPSPFTLKWKVDGTETTSGVETTKPTKQGDKYLASSYLTRSDSDYGDHTYVCEVIHNGKTFTKALTGSGSC